jgi:hypothetical protein
MRFFGGGIGHKATYNYTAALRADALAMVNTYSASAALAVVDDKLQVVPESEEDRLAERDDYGYELSDEEDCESNDEDDNPANLGAEDGEEPWAMDYLQAEGYDEL